jgi:hypothetical protein
MRLTFVLLGATDEKNPVGIFPVAPDMVRAANKFKTTTT